MKSINPKKVISALCLALAPCLAHATIYFQNPGNTSGWDQLYVEHNGSVTTVSSPTYGSESTSIQAEQIYDSSYTGRYHAEARYFQGASEGWDRYYGYAMYLPSNWQFVNETFNIMQFIGTPPCSTSGGQPWTMLWIRTNSLMTRITTGPDACTRTDQNFTITSNYTSGTWHTIVLHANWESDNTGIFTLWYDGSKVIDQQGVPTCPANGVTMEFAIGQYANGWHDTGTMLGTQSVRDVYEDQITIASSYAEANPAAVTSFTITASAGAGGTISPSGAVSATQGSNQTFTIAANSGYAISSVTVDGVNQGALSSYTFGNVQANHTIAAAFSAVTSSNVAPNGTAYGWSANTSSTANTNRAAQPGLNDNNLTANVDLNSAGDAIGAWEGAGVIWSSAQTISSAKFINGDITTGGDGFLTANCTLQYSTDGSTWTNTGWTITPSYPNSSSAGGQTYSASGTALSGVLGMRFVGQVRTVDTSYHWIVKEVQFIGSGGSTVTNFTITASAGTGGSISPSGSVSVAQGTNQTFTVTANSGYTISSVTVDGVNQGALSSYTFGNVQANHTISAAFSGTVTDTNIAPNGTAYGWSANTSSSSNSNRVTQPGLNDNNLTADVDLDPNGDAIGAWEAAGVIWSSAKTISSANFINGTITSGGDGFLTANLFMQYTTDGVTWNSSGWSISPAYPYSSSAGGQTYTASGTTLSGVLGVRFIGQVRTTDTSYHWIVKEVQFIGH